MKKRYALVGLTAVLALSLAVPALGGPSNPIAEVAGIKQKVKKAQRTANRAKAAAKKAKQIARNANTNSGDALDNSNRALARANANEADFGCQPDGYTLVGGVCVENQLNAARDYFAAQDFCEGTRRFLPGVDDLIHYFAKTGRDPGTAAVREEWSYERLAGTTSQTVALISERPQHTEENRDTELPFRCVRFAGRFGG